MLAIAGRAIALSARSSRCTALSAFMPSAIRSPVRPGFVAAVTTSTSMRSAVKQRRSLPNARRAGTAAASCSSNAGSANTDLLVLKRNYADPLVLLPWRMWARLLERVRAWTDRASASTNDINGAACRWRSVSNAKLVEYRRQAWRLALLVRKARSTRRLRLIASTRFAIAHAIVRALGADRVQAILDEAFGARLSPNAGEVA